MNNHLHPIFQQILMPYAPPAGDGQQQATERPDERFLTAVENLHCGGYVREAQLLEEARLAIEQLVLCLRSPKAERFADGVIEAAESVVRDITA